MSLESGHGFEEEATVFDAQVETGEVEKGVEQAFDQADHEAGILIEKFVDAGMVPNLPPKIEKTFLKRINGGRLTKTLQMLVLGLTMAGSAEAIAKPQKEAPVKVDKEKTQKGERSEKRMEEVKKMISELKAGVERLSTGPDEDLVLSDDWMNKALEHYIGGRDGETNFFNMLRTRARKLLAYDTAKRIVAEGDNLGGNEKRLSEDDQRLLESVISFEMRELATDINRRFGDVLNIKFQPYIMGQ